jgi:hypothetical protein
MNRISEQEKGRIIIHKDGSQEETSSFSVGPENINKDGTINTQEEETVTVEDHRHPQVCA